MPLLLVTRTFWLKVRRHRCIAEFLHALRDPRLPPPCPLPAASRGSRGNVPATMLALLWSCQVTDMVAGTAARVWLLAAAAALPGKNTGAVGLVTRVKATFPADVWC